MESRSITASPHFHTRTDTQAIMRDVLIAMCPALLAAMIIFGWRVLLICSVCVASCVALEFLFCKLSRRGNTIPDLSAVITGLLLAFNLPAGILLWIAAIGSAIAIVIVKQLFGGLGKNLLNPAMAARYILTIVFMEQMTTWVLPVSQQTVDAVASASTLPFEGSYLQLFLGDTGGSLGETCTLALLLGLAYLLIRRVITPTIPFETTIAISFSPSASIKTSRIRIGSLKSAKA